MWGRSGLLSALFVRAIVSQCPELFSLWSQGHQTTVHLCAALFQTRAECDQGGNHMVPTPAGEVEAPVRSVWVHLPCS